jgi:hypothetical protein
MADGILHARLPFTSRFPALTASDPSWVFAIKSLLHPVVAVACLLGCMLAWREPLYGPYFLLAVLTFFTAAQFLDIVDAPRGLVRPLSRGSILDLLLRWLLIVGFLCLVLHLSGISERIRWKVLLTWAFVTPTALWLSEVLAHKLLNRPATVRRHPRKAVILGMTEVGLRLKQRLEADPLLHIQVSGFFDERRPVRAVDSEPVSTRESDSRDIQLTQAHSRHLFTSTQLKVRVFLGFSSRGMLAERGITGKYQGINCVPTVNEYRIRHDAVEIRSARCPPTSPHATSSRCHVTQ